MSFEQQARATVEAAPPSVYRDRALRLIDGDIAPNEEGHLTGSALVVDHDRRRLLVLLHRKLQKWLQPGGHVEEGDADLAATALREASEETGIAGLTVEPTPLDVDVHWVGTHYHYDVRFLVVAPPGAEAVGNHESDEIRWIEPTAAALDAIDADESLRRLTASFFSEMRTPGARISEKNGERGRASGWLP